MEMEDPVLHVAAPGDVGGLERVVGILAPAQAARGRPVALLAVVDEGREEDHPFVESLRGSGVRIHVAGLPPRAYLRERRAVGRALAAERPGVVHTHGYRPDVVDAPVARSRGAATVTTVHGFTGGGRKNRAYEFLQRRSHRRFDAVVAVSAPLARALEGEGVPPERVHVIRNAWGSASRPLHRSEARRILGASPGTVRVGWVGRLSPEKGPDVLVDAMASLQDPPVQASVVGTGPWAAHLRERASRAGAAHRISWHGAVPDVARCFGAFDLFVLSSRSEGTPMVLFEAMASETPVVASRVGGVPDVVSEREAVLVPPDDPDALARAIREVVLEPDAARRRARAAKQRLRDEFAVDPWVDAYDDLYRSLTGSPLGAPGAT